MIRYQCSTGESIRLDAQGFYADEGTLRDVEWDYTYTGFPDGSGGSVGAFTRNGKAKSFHVSAHAYNRADLCRLLNRLHNLTEYDVRMKTPGRLWLDDQFLTCYLVASEISNKSMKAFFVTKKVTILPTIPYWCTTKAFNYSPQLVNGGACKRFPNRYPYKYTTGYTSSKLGNGESPWPSPMIITFYGEAALPSITIGSNVYTVNAPLLKGERIVVDQLKRTIIKYDSYGGVFNVFDKRDKTRDIFAPAPAGISNVYYTAGQQVSITLIQQRSEPMWT